jgi:cytochrome c oxidase cbb3-type subunit 3
MKPFFVTISVTIVSILFLGNCGTIRNAGTDETDHSGKSPLVAYGAALFQRESCGNCHTFFIEQESKRLISLDGVGGKYPNSYLYMYLLDPEVLIPGSKKKSYAALAVNSLRKGFVEEGGEESSWETMTEEANGIRQELASEGIETENTELVALIAYLQQIPASKRKMELDSLAHVEDLRRQQKWGDILLDSANIILEIAADASNIEKGNVLFQSYCSVCHGAAGQGGIGPNLTDEYWIHGGRKSEIAKTIIFGVPEKGMIPWMNILTPTEVGELIAFIASLQGTEPENAKSPQGKKE